MADTNTPKSVLTPNLETTEALGVPEATTRRRLVGLMVAASLTALAPAVGAQSASADKGFGQVVDTPFGRLSFLEIQKHEKRDEILDDYMTPDQSKAYITWKKGQTQVAIEEGNLAAQRKQVAIEELSKNAKELEKTVRATLDARLKIPVKYRHTMETIITFGKPPETVRYFQEVLKNPNNFA